MNANPTARSGTWALGGLALLGLQACFPGDSPIREESETTRDSACVSCDTAPPDSGHADTDTTDTIPPSDPFFGDPYLPPLDLPAFQTLNADGSPRSQADLLDHPTVLWFFRQAGGST